MAFKNEPPDSNSNATKLFCKLHELQESGCNTEKQYQELEGAIDIIPN